MKNEWDQIANQASTIQSTKNAVLNPILFELLKKYAKGPKLFDYGCGWGEFADAAQKVGFEVWAFDDADEMVAQAKHKFHTPTFLTKTEFEKQLPGLKETFDVVVSNLVLCILENKEHDIMLNNIASVVKKKALSSLVFATLNTTTCQIVWSRRDLFPIMCNILMSFCTKKKLRKTAFVFTTITDRLNITAIFFKNIRS